MNAAPNPPSYFLERGHPYGSCLGSHTAEEGALQYVEALSQAGNTWRTLPFAEARCVLASLNDTSEHSAFALWWDKFPITYERACLIWGEQPSGLNQPFTPSDAAGVG